MQYFFGYEFIELFSSIHKTFSSPFIFLFLYPEKVIYSNVFHFINDDGDGDDDDILILIPATVCVCAWKWVRWENFNLNETISGESFWKSELKIFDNA